MCESEGLAKPNPAQQQKKNFFLKTVQANARETSFPGQDATVTRARLNPDGVGQD